MKRFSDYFISFFISLFVMLPIAMISSYLYCNTERMHDVKNNIIENSNSKHTNSMELYCMTSDAVQFKIEITHYSDLDNSYQIYNYIREYFLNVEYKNLEDEFIKLYQHLTNICKDDICKLQSIQLNVI